LPLPNYSFSAKKPLFEPRAIQVIARPNAFAKAHYGSRHLAALQPLLARHEQLSDESILLVVQRLDIAARISDGDSFTLACFLLTSLTPV